jgi:RNA polymerase sigma factor (sigma-70 family)
VERYHELRGRNQGLAGSVTLEEINFASEEPTPEEVADEQSIRAVLQQGIASLSEREKTIVALYYDRELTLREIGAVLEVSESRVSQMLTAIAKQLRSLINGSGQSAAEKIGQMNGKASSRARESAQKGRELQG